MAWLYKQPGSSNWWIGYRAGGKQFLKSTKTSDRKEAEAQLRAVNLMFGAKESTSLLDDVYAALSGKPMVKHTLSGTIKAWLAIVGNTTKPRTLEKYQAFAQTFKQYMNATATAPLLADVNADCCMGFLQKKRERASASTVNGTRKMMKVFFNWALESGKIKTDPMTSIKTFVSSADEASGRRALTIQEIKTLYAKAPDDFWRYMILTAFYTGLRMGDLASLCWGNVDFESNCIRLKVGKTGQPLTIPMAAPVRACLASRRKQFSTTTPGDHIWPEQAKLYASRRSGPLSNAFHDIMLSAGLVSARNKCHRAEKNGRDFKRAESKTSFHSIRHSFVSLLKITGAGQAVAKELAGHNSDLVSDGYTHIPTDVLAGAINKLPKI